MTGTSMMQRWVSLFPSVSLDCSLYWYRWVKAHYEAPGRYFHDFGHIEHILLVAEEYLDFVPRTVLIAIWLHDIVYAPGSPFNESDSAAVARMILVHLGVSSQDIELIAEMIECTKTHIATSWQAAILCDLDLSSLGSSPDIYQEGSAKIQKEFAAFSASEQSIGRNVFIKRMLGREWIYSTDLFRKMFEAQARDNLQAELDTW